MSAFDAYCELLGNIKGEVLADEPLSRHTSYRIGGPTDLFIRAFGFHDLRLVLEVLERHEVPWVILGKGTNVLAADQGYRGAVITLGSEFNRFTISETGSVTAGAGVTLARIVQDAYAHGFSGLEGLVGVPGTVGGAVAMNAGTRDEWISSRITSVVVYKKGIGMKRYHADEIGWYYRCTTLPSDEIILEVDLQLELGDERSIRDKMEAGLARRKRTQPLNKPSCGSVFRNPAQHSVGRLIEELNLKGYSVGDAQVSSIHGNFIINNGRACAADVLCIMQEISSRVQQTYGISLTPEVKFLGFGC